MEMALLIANDALKYPVSGGAVHGNPRPLEMFDEEELNRARMEVALELSAEDIPIAQFEQACIDLHGSSSLPGLSGYNQDEIDDPHLIVKAFDVSFYRSRLMES